MARNLPPPSSPAAPETVDEHLRIGRRWLAAALEAHPDLSPAEALAAVQGEGGPLDPSSVGRYRADLKYTLRAVMGDGAAFDEAWRLVDKALSARKARIPADQKRTSALKVTDATDSEARALFYELKRHTIRHENPTSILAGLFVLVAGHAGFRPVELLHARLEGSILTLPNAKRRPGHEPTRSLDLSGLHADVVAGVHLLLQLIDHDLTKRQFAQWQKAVAEQMRRACRRIGIRGLGLYSFRHVAIATWSRAGLSPAEIARLCGHISVKTAPSHYARAAVGHRRQAVARAATMPVSTPRTGGPAAPTPAPPPGPAIAAPPVAPDPAFKLPDRPVPPRKDLRPPPMSVEEARAAFSRHAAPGTTGQIAVSLEKARLRHEGGHATPGGAAPSDEAPADDETASPPH